MQKSSQPYIWTQVATAVLIATIHLAATVPIAGATYRPFSWMTLARADAATLYPVIQELTFNAQGVAVSADVTPGMLCALQSSTNLMEPNGWQTVAQCAATNPWVMLLHSNPVARTLYYRVIQIMEPETP